MLPVVVLTAISSPHGVGAQEPPRLTVGDHVPGLMAAPAGPALERHRRLADEPGGPVGEGVLPVIVRRFVG